MYILRVKQIMESAKLYYKEQIVIPLLSIYFLKNMLHSFNIHMTITFTSTVTLLPFSIIKEGSVGKEKKKKSQMSPDESLLCLQTQLKLMEKIFSKLH